MKTATATPLSSPNTSNPTAMLSVVQRRYGIDADRVLSVETVDRPAPEDQQVLVRVCAASVDMGTWHCMTGMPYAMRLMGFGLRSPKTKNPGRAVAGIVESVGPGVTAFTVGDQVYGSCDAAFSEYVAVDTSQLAIKPASLTFEQAAALPISGGTALQAIQKGNLQAGQNLLILGASGGVGTLAVQLAKAYGARVTGVCSTSKTDLVRSIGADEIIDYTQNDVTKNDARYELIIDTGGNRPLTQLRRLLTQQGTLVIVGGENGGRWFGGFLGQSLRAMVLSVGRPQKLSMLTSVESTEVLDRLRDLIESHAITPVVDRTYSLQDTSTAIHDLRAGRARGKLVIAIEQTHQSGPSVVVG